MSISPTLSSSTQTAATSSTTQSSGTATTPNDVLGKDAFLQLLVTQLKNQDPSSPVDDTQFISEMAQFTSLEQTQNMSDSITQLVQSQTGSALGTSATMIGKTITWTPSTSTAGTSDSTPQSGVVTSVSFNNGQITYMVGNTAVDPSTITMVENSSSDPASSSSNSATGNMA